MTWRYKIEGSDDVHHWRTVEVAETRSKAEIKLDHHRQHGMYSYYQIRERWRSRIKRIIKFPFTWISKQLSYMTAPISEAELKGIKLGSEFESLDNYSTHISKDTRFLVAKMFPVIIHLFNSSDVYKKLILDSLDYMMEVTTKKFKDYPEVKGISGANVGIPFNLVVMKVCKIGDAVPEDLDGMTIKYKGYHFLHMINPKIEDHSSKTFKPLTNCGSLRLEREIRIERYSWVQVLFYDREGDKHRRSIDRPISGTAQHEIDHNNGVLITDREIKVGEENDRS